MSEPNDKMLGQLVLGRYRIVKLLAQGGMGAVYLARVEGAAGFARPVVVKRILPHLSDSIDDQERFIREAQILSNIRHPGIVNVIDFGKVAGAYLMVLEYVHGYHLGQWMKYVIQSRDRMSWEFSLLVMLQVLAALQYAHTHKHSDGSRATIIHGDVSPGNILIDVEGNVRLADFGIARIEAEQTTRKATVDGIFRGKLSYAAPELLACENATRSSDIYACGVVLHQMLAGVNPFNAQEANDIISRMLALVPPPVSSLRSDVPRGLDGVLAKALARKPGQRPASALDFAVALRRQLIRSEADIAAEMTAVIQSDFTGNFAGALGVTPLDELEAAWRKSSDYPVSPSPLSMPPTVDLRQFGQKRDAPEDSLATATLTELRDAEPVAGINNRRLIITVVVAAQAARIQHPDHCACSLSCPCQFDAWSGMAVVVAAHVERRSALVWPSASASLFRRFSVVTTNSRNCLNCRCCVAFRIRWRGPKAFLALAAVIRRGPPVGRASNFKACYHIQHDQRLRGCKAAVLAFRFDESHVGRLRFRSGEHQLHGRQLRHGWNGGHDYAATQWPTHRHVAWLLRCNVHQ